MLENVGFYFNVQSIPIHIICPLLEMEGLCFILVMIVSCETLCFSKYKNAQLGPRVWVSCTVFNSICLSIAPFLVIIRKFYAFCCDFHKNVFSFFVAR